LEEDLARDWRVRSKFEQKFGEYWDYYWAYGKKCPAKVKRKTLLDDVIIYSTNGSDIANYRQF
jgi:hypothetical protein